MSRVSSCLPDRARVLPIARAALAALIAVVVTGCPDSVGITCPPGQQFCSGEDLAAPTPDLPPAPPVDAARAPDLYSCEVACTGGCCDPQGACHAPGTLSGCGTAGEQCKPCDSAASDTCTAKGCACGGSPPCAPGTHCAGGRCICDKTSCMDGCCDDNGRCRAFAIDSCADHGELCKPCDQDLSDGCLNGCSCGNGPACHRGQRCDKGACVCDHDTCKDGCCAGADCQTPSPMACGIDGNACAACNPNLADRCSDGQCSCGQNPACAPGIGQRCVGGQCVCDGISCPKGCCHQSMCRPGIDLSSCGSGGNQCVACPFNQLCNNGVCAGCNGQTCPNGCCSGSMCVMSQMNCAVGGAVCAPCGINADHCDAGTCKCGANAACSTGQECVNGMCACTPRACFFGCCNANTCVLGTDVAACGAKGNMCIGCAKGQECASGSCVCTPKSCGSGCCAGASCVTPPTASACGNNGGACMTCPNNKADTCAAGKCQCGGAPACPSSLNCEKGVCVCTPNSCGGCCLNNTTCIPLNAIGNTNCGQLGGACVTCDPVRAPTCAKGVCTCAGNAACLPGQACGNNGGCVCNALSCPNGCCQNNLCMQGLDNLACGIAGLACQVCPNGQMCANGVCAGPRACINGQVFCPAINQCAKDCSLCNSGPLDCAGTCVSDCQVQCNGQSTCKPGTCVASCMACNGSPITCQTVMGRRCLAACDAQTCAGGKCF